MLMISGRSLSTRDSAAIDHDTGTAETRSQAVFTGSFLLIPGTHSLFPANLCRSSSYSWPVSLPVPCLCVYTLLARLWGYSRGQPHVRRESTSRNLIDEYYTAGVNRSKSTVFILLSYRLFFIGLFGVDVSFLLKLILQNRARFCRWNILARAVLIFFYNYYSSIIITTYFTMFSTGIYHAIQFHKLQRKSLMRLEHCKVYVAISLLSKNQTRFDVTPKCFLVQRRGSIRSSVETISCLSNVYKSNISIRRIHPRQIKRAYRRGII